jgi:hypothetical protein
MEGMRVNKLNYAIKETGFLLSHHFAILPAAKRIKDDARHYVSKQRRHSSFCHFSESKI